MEELEPSFRISLDHPVESLDPHLTEDPESLKITSLIFDSLLAFDYEKRPYEIKAALVSELPTVSADQLTLTFKLKKGLEYEKGKELKADDVLFSLKRMVDPNLNSATSWMFEGKVLGLQEWRQTQANAGKTDYKADLDGFKKVDDYTLQIVLTQKFPQIFQLLALPQTAIVPQSIFSGKGNVGTNPSNLIGTGPYKLLSEEEGGQIFYVAKKGAHPDKNYGADSFVQPLSVKAQKYSNENEKWQAFNDNRLDLIKIPLDLMEEVIDTKSLQLSDEYAAKQFKVHQSTQLETEYLAFNMEDPFIKKAGPKFRKAIALALNKQDIIDRFYGGSAIVAQSPIPPNLFGYEDSYSNPYSKFDLSEAKKLLREAGFPNGKGVPVLKHEYLSNKFVQQNAEYFKTAMKELGIEVDLVLDSEEEFFNKIKSSQAQIWRISWIYDYPDAENFLQVFYGPNKGGAGPNSSNYQNESYDKMYEDMKSMFDVPEKLALIRKMKKQLEDDLPWIPLLHKVDYYLSQQQVDNFKPGYLGGSPARWVKVKKITPEN